MKEQQYRPLRMRIAIAWVTAAAMAACGGSESITPHHAVAPPQQSGPPEPPPPEPLSGTPTVLSPDAMQIGGWLTTSLAAALHEQEIPAGWGISVSVDPTVESELQALGGPSQIIASFVDVSALAVLAPGAAMTSERSEPAPEMSTVRARLRLVFFPNGALRWGPASIALVDSEPGQEAPVALEAPNPTMTSFVLLTTESLSAMGEGCRVPFTEVADLRRIPRLLHAELYPEPTRAIATCNAADTLSGTWQSEPGMVGQVLRSGNRLLAVGGPVRLSESGERLEVGPVRSVRLTEEAMRQGLSALAGSSATQ